MKYTFPFTILYLLLVSCNQNTSQNEVTKTASFDKDVYIDKGLEIAGYAQSAIGGALQSAMQDGGVPNALSVCNVKALPITDSLAQHHNITLQRVSDKNRNPENKASENDLLILNKFKDLLAEDEPAMPLVEKQGKEVVFYHAIIANTNCMKCHGKVGEDISENNYGKILSLYPNDLATGYEPGQIRGAFKIIFN